MIKKVILASAVSMLLIGCSSSNTGTSKFTVTEATDYAMSCDSILNEIRAIKAKLNNDENLLEKFVPDYLLTKEPLTECDELILSERKKSLQLIYTLKEVKKECRTLTVNDTKEKSKIVQAIDQVKKTVKDVQ